MKKNILVIVIAAGTVAIRVVGQGAAPVPVATTTQPAPAAESKQLEDARLLQEMAVQADEINQAVSGQGGSYSYYSAPDYSNPFGSWGGARELEGSVSVVDFKAPDQKTVDETGEDLKVMSLLFTHNLDKAFANDQPDYKLGIPLLLKSQGHSVEASYIEGVGALFSLRVRFPIVAPTVEESNAAPAQKDSAWARAQRELAGEPEKSPRGGAVFFGQESTPPYQSNLVETLKKQVIETLGEASNFRHLAPNETIMVTVTGAPNATAASRAVNDPTATQPQPAGGTGTITATPFGAATGAHWYKKHAGHNGSNRSTLMTIRIKQSDAQALADHKMSHEDFIKAAQVTMYLGPSAQPTSGAFQEK